APRRARRRAAHQMTCGLRRLLLLVVALAGIASTACAQDYPTRRITIVVPFTPGSAFDLVARVTGQKLTERWGQPVIVDNKPGARGSLGMEFAAAAQPDGYTIVTAGAPQTVQPWVMKNLRYDPVKSFTPIGIIATNTVVLVVNPRVFPASSLDDLIAKVKASPGKYNYSSPGVGTLQQLGMELFKQQLGLDILHVPDRGQAQAMTDLIAGQNHMTFVPVNTVLAHVQAGKLRIIAAAGTKRSPI